MRQRTLVNYAHYPAFSCPITDRSGNGFDFDEVAASLARTRLVVPSSVVEDGDVTEYSESEGCVSDSDDELVVDGTRKRSRSNSPNDSDDSADGPALGALASVGQRARDAAAERLAEAAQINEMCSQTADKEREYVFAE